MRVRRLLGIFALLAPCAAHADLGAIGDHLPGYVESFVPPGRYRPGIPGLTVPLPGERPMVPAPLGPRLPPMSPPRDDGLLVDIAKARLLGKAVIALDATGVAYRAVPPFAPDQSLESRVQALAKVYSEGDRLLSAFAVNHTWVIAPAQRDEIATSLKGVDPLEGMGGQTLWQDAMTLLSPAQVTGLAGPEGIVLSELPTAAQDRMRRALALLEWVSTDEDGRPSRPVPFAMPDSAGLRVQAIVRTYRPILSLRRTENGASRIYPVPLDGAVLAPLTPILTGVGAGTAILLPDVERVDNTLKPSDLNTAKLRVPFGTQGVFSVNDALRHAAGVTGLALHSGPEYGAVKVFIGSDAIPTGDVLDGIRLGLTAAWRRLGDRYLLVYERDGLGALSQRIEESGADIANVVWRRATDALGDPVWRDLARQAGFVASDPLALTPDQRTALYANNPDGVTVPRRVIAWTEMTPGQQAAILEGLRNSDSNSPGSVNVRPPIGPVTPEDATLAVLTGRVQVQFRISIPDIGWVYLPTNWGRVTEPAESFLERQTAARASGDTAPAPALMREPQREQPTILAARRRAILTAPMSTSEIEPLAMLMRARGFNTLFYPLLVTGKATIATRAFPPHPALMSGGGFADVTRVMQRHGVTVVGYLDTLVWRPSGEKNHWITKHPDWLDRDIMGRPFSESVRGFGAADIGPRHATPPMVARGDLVRATEPAVAARLEALVRDAAALPQLSGILFDGWTPGTAVVMTRRVLPRWNAMAGFAAADRIAAVAETGVDPVDRPLTGQTASHLRDLLAVPPSLPFATWTGEPAAETPANPYRVLLSRLAAVRPADGRPWTTYAVQSGPVTTYEMLVRPKETPLPVTVTLDGPIGSYAPTKRSGGESHIFPVAPRRPQTGRPFDPSTPAIIAAEGDVPPYMPPPAPLDLAVYDFRAAPGELMDSLRRVGLPEPLTAAPGRPVG